MKMKLMFPPGATDPEVSIVWDEHGRKVTFDRVSGEDYAVVDNKVHPNIFTRIDGKLPEGYELVAF